MRRPIAILALCLPLMLAGCKTTAPTPPLAPGYQNAADQSMGEILAGARSFYSTIQSESAAGKVTLSATEKQAFNAFGVTINQAEAIYLAYHSGSATQAAAQTAVNAVQSQQSALPIPAVQQ